MSDYFTELFIDNPTAFAVLHEGLTKEGYVTDDDEPHLNRPAHNSLTEERYTQIFKKHYPSQYTDVLATSCAFDVGDGFPSFYVVYDRTQFEDRGELERELKRVGVLK